MPSFTDTYLDQFIIFLLEKKENFLYKIINLVNT